MPAATKPCIRPGCGRTFTRKPREDAWRWNRRKYCSKRCASIDTRTVKKTGVDDRQRGKKCISLRFQNGEVLLETWHIGGVKAVITYADKSRLTIDGERK